MTGRGKTLLALAAVASTAVALWLTNRAVTPKEYTWNDVVSEARKGGYRLVTTDELWERNHKGSRELLIVDTRQEWEYRTGHIDGAVNFPMEPTWWSRWRNASDLGSLLGPDKDRFLVFY
jgi:3-mercaptopyruvate sulfurtransferase SseA